jgi:hypothetical protein
LIKLLLIPLISFCQLFLKEKVGRKSLV